mmetsp:Transcript_23873/g.54344  ORF Transcript_23873/g.54344 Transcript_23873/m.54344 type:complete len:331 (-) Transcript_23873:1130-2122(-)
MAHIAQVFKNGQTDAIKESHGRAFGTSDIMRALAESYRGQTACCGLLCRWLAMVNAARSSPTQAFTIATSTGNCAATDKVRSLVERIIFNMAVQRFVVGPSDEDILGMNKRDTTFVEQMMESARWRRLLIDLVGRNRGSVFLMFCLQKISMGGHHREIAARMDQSEHFAVFNGMLASEVRIAGALGCGHEGGEDGEGDEASSSQARKSGTRMQTVSTMLEDLIGDLRRTCTSTAYTYMYALDLLENLIKKAEDKEKLQLSRRKWTRLKEELEFAMFDPVKSGHMEKKTKGRYGHHRHRSFSTSAQSTATPKRTVRCSHGRQRHSGIRSAR